MIVIAREERKGKAVDHCVMISPTSVSLDTVANDVTLGLFGRDAKLIAAF